MAFITISERDELVDTILRHYALYRSKPALDQLAAGLNAFGVADAIRQYPDLLEEFFIAGKLAPLTAGNALCMHIYNSWHCVAIEANLFTMQ